MSPNTRHESVRGSVMLYGLLVLAVAMLFLPAAALGQTYLRQPGGGSGSLQVGQDCQLGQLVTPVDAGWADHLAFRLMGADRTWSALETVHPMRGAGSPGSVSKDAALFHRNTNGSHHWEAVLLDGATELHIKRRDKAGKWSAVAEYVMDAYGSGDASIAVAADGSGGYHILWLHHSSAPVLRYLYFDGTAWTEQSLGTFNGATEMQAFDTPHNLEPPRSLDLLMDATGTLHAVYSAGQTDQPVSGGTLVRSDLWYRSRTNGSWSQPEIVVSGGSSDDAGLGAALALAPDGTVALAAAYLPRAGTGSPNRASLRYLRRTAEGTWHSETVTSAADGYASRDGQQGTGFYPDLSFDPEGRPHIVFNDHASEHTQGTAFSYVGQVRYATRDNPHSGAWTLQTLVSQSTSDAFLRRASPPVLATGGANCPDVIAFFAGYADFDEPNFTWNHFEFAEVEGVLGSGSVWYDGAENLGGDWRWLPWLRGFNVSQEPWIFHPQHGWMYPFGADPATGMYFWDARQQTFLYTGSNLYPTMFRFADGKWIRYRIGSSSPRWFVDLATGVWESLE